MHLTMPRPHRSAGKPWKADLLAAGPGSFAVRKTFGDSTASSLTGSSSPGERSWRPLARSRPISVMCSIPRAGPWPSSWTSTQTRSFLTLLTTPVAQRSGGRAAARAVTSCDMERASCSSFSFTSSTLTSTSWPADTASDALATKELLSSDLCTRPVTAGPPSGGWMWTKAPKSMTRCTTPGSHRSRRTAWNAESSPFIESERRSSTSTPSTLTGTFWPTDTSSSTLCTKPWLISALCTKPG
mmetsp:Transcript_30864/g.98477  ORF Transcript_30864/g.98477 Transcript_30864/m.98477 type:complete len:242 (+) Transcript_30864:337-1062(+)